LATQRNRTKKTGRDEGKPFICLAKIRTGKGNQGLPCEGRRKNGERDGQEKGRVAGEYKAQSWDATFSADFGGRTTASKKRVRKYSLLGNLFLKNARYPRERRALLK